MSSPRNPSLISRTFERGLQALLVLNALDAVFTSWWVAAGWADEANPMMAYVLEHGLAAFIFVKLAIGMAAALTLRAHGNRRLARVGLAAVLVAYAGVLFIHLQASAAQYASGTLLTVASR